ncbi:MAG: MBL fold metallo-hydrolase, partial [bacterium]
MLSRNAFLYIALCSAVLGSTRPSGNVEKPRGAVKPSARVADTTLNIYIADTEGGKATLFVTPSGETVLVDTGNPGARDGDRIMEMITSAGVTKIDYLISTHYHTDHIGGLQELVKRVILPFGVGRKLVGRISSDFANRATGVPLDLIERA